MKHKKKAFGAICGWLTALIAAASVGGAYIPAKAADQSWPIGPDTSSVSAIVIEQETGTVLYEKNADQQNYPASITKIMTALLALENSSLDDVVTFSHKAVYTCEGDTSNIAREEGEQMTMEQCLYGMMLESANECAYAIAEYVGGGDVNNFTDMMNQKAKELGCTNTHFSNPNGLPAEDHYTSARDMARIAQAAFQNEEFQTIVGTKSYQIPPTNKHADPTPLNNHHAMLNYYKTSRYLYPYCLGGKTGYTTEANSTLVTYARKDGMTLVCVVMNAESPAHYVDTTNLFNWCFDQFTQYKVADQENLMSSETKKDLGDLAPDADLLTIDDSGVVILPNGVNLSDAECEVVPLKKAQGDVIGRIVYTYAGKTVGGADIHYSGDLSSEDTYPFHNVDASEGGSTVKSLHINYLMILLFAAIAAAIVILVLLLRKNAGEINLYRHRRRRDHQPVAPKRHYTSIRKNDSAKKRHKRHKDAVSTSKEDNYKKINRRK